MTRTTDGRPLTPAVFHILLALADGPRHGYGIMKQVAIDSGGSVSMGPGTLYGSIGRMMDGGLVREGASRADPALDDERRIYYELTAAGQGALGTELARYRDVVAVAARRLADPS
jgi:DNA-binding PadR family transcriptional regulator